MFQNKFILFLISITLLSCSNNIAFDKSKNINDSTWNYLDTLNYYFDVEHTNKTYNVFIQLKTTNNYRYSNLFIFTKIKGPKNESLVDTVDCILANKEGKWYGKENSNQWYNKLMFRKRIRFPEKGKYCFSFIQAMRENNLKDITNFGLIIEEAKKD